MELVLHRSYYKGGTNSALFLNGHFVCFAIELAWKDNQQNISCIPEGTYELKARTSKKFGQHLHVMGVRSRSLILIHPANNAQKDLRGCLAPVSQLSGIGLGWSSRASLRKLLIFFYQAKERGEETLLTIKKTPYEHC